MKVKVKVKAKMKLNTNFHNTNLYYYLPLQLIMSVHFCHLCFFPAERTCLCTCQQFSISVCHIVDPDQIQQLSSLEEKNYQRNFVTFIDSVYFFIFLPYLFIYLFAWSRLISLQFPTLADILNQPFCLTFVFFFF